LKWLKGESVPIASYEKVQQQSTFNYRLSEDLVAHSFQELAEMMLENQELALKHIKRQHFFEAFHHYQDLAARLYDIRDKNHPSERSLLSGIIYTLAPDLPYKLMEGFEASTPGELARIIDLNRQTWEKGKEQLFNGSIPAWLRAIGYEEIANAWEEEAHKYKRN